MYRTEVMKITSKIVQFFLQKIGVKINPNKIKKLNDLGFIFIEKIIVNLDKLYSFYLDFYDEMIKNEITIKFKIKMIRM